MSNKNKKQQRQTTDAKVALRQNKRLRRKWITFVRMCRYGINNFTRNAWLTIAATAVMTITLLIVFSTLAARHALLSTVDDFKSKVDISIYLKNDTNQETVNQLENKLRGLKSVESVRFISADEFQKDSVASGDLPKDQLKTIADLPETPYPATLRVVPTDLDNLGSIESLVKNDKTFKSSVDSDRKPTFASSRRKAIDNIGQAVQFISRVGTIASIVFIAISVLIIFNTIRMAIFNRKDEIEMMKLIGADRNFIRGPFTVEAIMYGFFAAIAATGLGWLGLGLLREPLAHSGIAIQPTLDLVTINIVFLFIGLVLVGAVIGVVSSVFAVHRYLKV